MEELHEHDKATVDHTTLLLNCYAKLKDTEKLEAFINSGSNFDLDTAIAMCRQGGYHDQAVFLARKHGEHEIVVDVLIEDSKKYDEALGYIWRLEPDMAYPNLMKYATVLLEHCPSSATQIFIDYYTGEYHPRKDQPLPTTVEPQSGMGMGLSNLTAFIPLPYRQAQISSPVTAGSQSLGGAETPDGNVSEPRLDYKVPRPRTAFSAFVDHPREFITFLEACVMQDSIEESDKVDLYTTLFEMYLDAASRKSGSEKDEWETKAKKLIYSKEVRYLWQHLFIIVSLTFPDSY